MASKEQHVFFVKERQQKIDIIVHLFSNTQSCVLIRGAKHSGKSFFIQRLQMQLPEHWVVSSAEAKALKEESNGHVLNCFDLVGHSAQSPERFFESCSRTGKKVALIVENIESLEKSEIEPLFDLGERYSCLSFIFTTSENLSVDIEEKCHCIDLAAFNQSQTSQYVSHLLETKGINKENIVTLDDVLLYIETGGLPGLIEKSVEQHLSGGVSEVKQKTQPQKRDQKPRWFGLLLIVPIVIGWVLLTDSDSTAPIKTGDGKEVSSESNHLPENKVVDIEILEPSTVISSSKTEDKNISIEDKKFPPTVLKTEGVSETKKEVLTSPPEDQAKKVSEEKEQKNEIVLKEPVKEPQTKNKPKTDLEKGKMELLGREDSRYTLQLLGVSTELAANRFLQKNIKMEGLFIYQNKRNKGQWYNVVYGDYVNKEEALKASKQLPKPLVSYSPWVRQLKDLKKDIYSSP